MAAADTANVPEIHSRAIAGVVPILHRFNAGPSAEHTLGGEVGVHAHLDHRPRAVVVVADLSFSVCPPNILLDDSTILTGDHVRFDDCLLLLCEQS